MKIWYTSRNKFISADEGWKTFIDWSGLVNVTTELLTLDTNLCEPCFQPDLNEAYTYEIALTTEAGYFADCYTTIDYVINNTPASSNFNILAVVYRPDQDCNNCELQGFIFVGYDLMDQSNGTSAVTNCGGFDDVFSIDILNCNGLIKDYVTATQVCEALLNTHPEEYHADTNVWAIWKKN